MINHKTYEFSEEQLEYLDRLMGQAVLRSNLLEVLKEAFVAGMELAQYEADSAATEKDRLDAARYRYLEDAKNTLTE